MNADEMRMKKAELVLENEKLLNEIASIEKELERAKFEVVDKDWFRRASDAKMWKKKRVREIMSEMVINSMNLKRANVQEDVEARRITLFVKLVAETVDRDDVDDMMREVDAMLPPPHDKDRLMWLVEQGFKNVP